MAHKNEKIITDLMIQLSEVQKENRKLRELNKELSKIAEDWMTMYDQLKNKYEREEVSC